MPVVSLEYNAFSRFFGIHCFCCSECLFFLIKNIEKHFYFAIFTIKKIEKHFYYFNFVIKDRYVAKRRRFWSSIFRCVANVLLMCC